jgi:hypothetical protein
MNDDKGDSIIEAQKKEEAIRLIVENARTVWRRIDTMHYLDLAKLYLAFSHAPDYDPDGKYREKILTLLPDWIIEAEFNNLEMPVRLVRIIEDRLRPPPPPDANSFDCGGAMVTPGPEND